MKSQQHVIDLAALIVVVVTTILVQTTPPRGAEAAAITSGNVSAANAVVFGVVPCSTGSSINVATAPPFPNASLQLQCGAASLAGNVSGRATTADSRGNFLVGVGIIRNANSSGGAVLSLSSMLLGNQCSVVVTTPLAACNVSLASANNGTLSAPVRVVGGGPLLGGLLGLAAGPFSFSFSNRSSSPLGRRRMMGS